MARRTPPPDQRLDFFRPWLLFRFRVAAAFFAERDRAAAGNGVLGCPRSTLGFLRGHAALLVALLDVLFLPLLLRCVLALVSPRHHALQVV